MTDTVFTTPKSQAGNLILEKASEQSSPQIHQVVRHGNSLLMEAQFLELVSNIRALHISNRDLKEALKEDPNDLDFLQALKENKYIILRKREEVLRLVFDMKRAGANIDVPDDIIAMKIDLPKDEANDANEGEGVYL
jgi:predicted ATPase with chaperone activity